MIATLSAIHKTHIFINKIFMVRVQEAAGSNPVTRTTRKCPVFLVLQGELDIFLCKMHTPPFMPSVQKVTFLYIHVHCFDCNFDCNSVASDCKRKDRRKWRSFLLLIPFCKHPTQFVFSDFFDHSHHFCVLSNFQEVDVVVHVSNLFYDIK